ncbi:MAG: hypothetical protein RL196_1555 [Actinomycetota bacterium]|jgi:heavy metal translocating P-type ATPase
MPNSQKLPLKAPSARWLVRAIREYSFLAFSLLALVMGLGFSAMGFGANFTNTAWAAGAAVGLFLALRWLVRAIREGEFGSDSLAVISIVATGITNEWLAASVISVMLASGRALEQWAEGRAKNQLAALLARAPQTAHRLSADGLVKDIALAEVAIGDKLLVKSGEVVPIDGLLTTEGTFDESALTGEPMPKWRAAGQEVSSGVLNSQAGVEMTAIRTAADSTYSGLIRLVEQAAAESANSVRLANRWAFIFVPFALALASATWLITGDYAPAVAVIVAATPCPLILAVPVAIIAGMSKASSRGAVIKGGAALEALARVETVLLDKTGTLTHGGPKVAAIAVAPGADADEVLALAASLEQSSPHVVAAAIIAEAKTRDLILVRAIDVTEEHGRGLAGHINGKRVEVGQPETTLPAWATAGLTDGRNLPTLLVAVTIDGQLKAVLGLDDPVRAESRATISALRKLGVTKILLVSGDRRATAQAVADEVGIDSVHAECNPEDKLRIVSAEMATAHGTVAAVGDGINDAPALAAASVGVAMGARGATAASEAADVVIIEDSLSHLATAIDIAQGARRRALQASGFGMSLAVGAMLLASIGTLDATASAVAQEFIDAGAILWALVPTRDRIQLGLGGKAETSGNRETSGKRDTSGNRKSRANL